MSAACGQGECRGGDDVRGCRKAIDVMWGSLACEDFGETAAESRPARRGDLGLPIDGVAMRNRSTRLLTMLSC